MSTHRPEHCWLKWHSTIFIFFHLSAFQYFYSPLCHQFHPGIKIPWLLHPLVMSWFGHAPTGSLPVCPHPFRALQTFSGEPDFSGDKWEGGDDQPTPAILLVQTNLNHSKGHTAKTALSALRDLLPIGSEAEPVLHLLHPCMLSRFSCVRLFVTPFPSPGESSRPTGWTHVSLVSCTSRQILYH